MLTASSGSSFAALERLAALASRLNAAGCRVRLSLNGAAVDVQIDGDEDALHYAQQLLSTVDYAWVTQRNPR